MDTNRPVLVASEEPESFPVLVIDKRGFIGGDLARRLQKHLLVVFVGHDSFAIGTEENIIHIPYRKRVPLIPDNKYSHIFVVYNGESAVLDMLPSFVEKANQTGGKLFFITPISQATQKLFRYLSNHLYHNIQVIVYGEVFDDKISEPNQVNFFIHQARAYGRVEVPNAGLATVYPILFDDVLSAIVQIAFAPEKRKRIVLLFTRNGITEISVARMLQQLDPMLKIDFKKQRNDQPRYYFPEEGEYFFPNYALDHGLRKINLARKQSSSKTVPQKKIRLVVPGRRKTRRIVGITVSAAVFFVIIPPILMVISALMGAWTLSQSIEKMEKAQFTSAQKYASFASSAFGSAKSMSEGLFLLDVVTPSQKEKLSEKMQFGKDIAGMGHDIADAGLSLQQVFGGKSLDPKNDFLHSTATLKNTLLSIQKLKAEGKLPKEAERKIDGMKYEISLFENLIDSLPTLLGFEGKRSYLVLFQNNMELRPGGGFIGSYGILNIENGKIDEFKVYDVYDADGKLKTHVEPPYGLRRYLGASHWFLRDSNYELDFIRNGANAARFLEMEVGQRVDGVIALDTEVLKGVLSAFGSVKVADYNETVTPDNFYFLTQDHAEKDFFPGSTQKKDFLRSLTTALTLELTESKEKPYGKLLKEVGKALREKHILFYFPDHASQDLFAVSGLSSSLWDGRSTEGNVFLDTFGMVDTNVGTNKGNYYVKRSVAQRAVIDETGTVTETAVVTYENTSTKNSPYGGEYKTYMRLILPENALLRSVVIDNRELPIVPAVTDPAIFTQKDFVPPAGLEVEELEEQDKKVVGFFVSVPMGSSKNVAITYSLPGVFNMQSPAFTYDLKVIKQPGTLRDPYSLTVIYPPGYRLLKGNGGSDVGGKVVYDSPLSEDRNVRVEFSKK